MTRLLSIEFFKIRHNRASKVLVLFYFGLLSCIALISALEVNLGPVNFKLAEQGIFEFPLIWHFNTYFAAILKFFLLLVIVSMVANEYSNKTLKQNLIDGLSKKEYILSKFYMVVVMALASTLYIFLVSLVLGLIYSTDKSVSVIFTDLEYLVAFFIKLISVFSMGLFMGIWIKRSAFAIGALFILYIIEGFVGLFISFSLGHETTAFIKSTFPFNSSESLIPNPIPRLESVQEVSSQLGGMYVQNYGVPIFNVFVSLVWTALFIYGAYALIKRRDL
jgi:ABC-type transport system involved in multi-copper enzyme maturation permease subunit